MKGGQIVVYQKPKGGKKQQGNSVKPAITALQYRGPLRVPRSVEGQELDTFQINFAATLASSGTGTLTTVITPSTQVTSSPDWTNIQNLWEEYRILSWEFEVVPWTPFTRPTTDVLAPVYSVIDRQTATALSALADAVGYGSCKMHKPSTPFKRTSRMTGADESEWVSTSTTPAAGAQAYLKLWSSGNSNSINLYDYKMIYLVQVKGRK